MFVPNDRRKVVKNKLKDLEMKKEKIDKLLNKYELVRNYEIIDSLEISKLERKKKEIEKEKYNVEVEVASI